MLCRFGLRRSFQATRLGLCVSVLPRSLYHHVMPAEEAAGITAGCRPPANGRAAQKRAAAEAAERERRLQMRGYGRGRVGPGRFGGRFGVPPAAAAAPEPPEDPAVREAALKAEAAADEAAAEKDAAAEAPDYTLTGVLVHQGFSASSGHYYAFVRDGTGAFACAWGSAL